MLLQNSFDCSVSAWKQLTLTTDNTHASGVTEADEVLEEHHVTNPGDDDNTLSKCPPGEDEAVILEQDENEQEEEETTEDDNESPDVVEAQQTGDSADNDGDDDDSSSTYSENMSTVVRRRRDGDAFLSDLGTPFGLKDHCADDEGYTWDDDEYIGLIPMLCARCGKLLKNNWSDERSIHFIVVVNVLLSVSIDFIFFLHNLFSPAIVKFERKNV